MTVADMGGCFYIFVVSVSAIRSIHSYRTAFNRQIYLLTFVLDIRNSSPNAIANTRKHQCIGTRLGTVHRVHVATIEYVSWSSWLKFLFHSVCLSHRYQFILLREFSRLLLSIYVRVRIFHLFVVCQQQRRKRIPWA